MKAIIEKDLHVLAELEAERELLPSIMIDDIVDAINREVVDLFGPDKHRNLVAMIKREIMKISRASIQRHHELDDEIKITRENISAMVKAHGATVKAAGFSASYTKPSVYADLKRLKLDVENDSTLAVYLKPKRPSCRIIRSKS